MLHLLGIDRTRLTWNHVGRQISPFRISALVAQMILTLLALSAHLQAADSARPNVLLILTDDQGYGDFSLHGNPYVTTPHVDKLATSGVQFERFYVNSFCAPTRAALLTGRWPLRTGCHGVTHNREAMRPSEVTLAEALGRAGYRSACIGKWHNGEQYPYTAQGQGFDQFFGFNNGHWNNYFDAVLLRGAQPEVTQGYISDVLTNEAMEFISTNQAGPFFCYLAFNAPHSPFQVPDKYFHKFKAQGLEDQLSAFYGMCENIDDNVGRLLAHLEKLQLSENTIVLFMTDNGGTAGVKTFNAGMRGGKTSVHEGGSRVPLFMHWPAAHWQPHTVKPITAHIDLYPTLLDLCGVPSPEGPPIDGVTLRPLLEQVSAGSWPERTLYTHNPIDESNRYPGAVRTQKYRLVREIIGPAGGSRAQADDANAQPWQLYDMENDPGQQHNIAAAHRAIVKELSDRYEKWYEDIAQERLQRFPLSVGHWQHTPVQLHAPQAYYDQPLKFANGPGFANDWLTGWTDVNAKVWWEIDVHQAGTYDIELAVSCRSEDAGGRVRLSAADDTLEFTLSSADAPEVPLPHRDQISQTRYRNRQWSKLKVGTLTLPAGFVKLTLQPTSMPGSQVMELKEVSLNWKPSAADSSWQEQAAAHARILSHVQWTPSGSTLPNRSGGYFTQGKTYTGVPYSSVRSEGRYIGFDIALRTFLAAVENPQSVLYTENLTGKVPNAAGFYGSVCSAYTSYALGCAFPEVSRRYGPQTKEGIQLVQPQSAQGVQVGDVIYTPHATESSGSHVEMITQVTRNADGQVVSVRVEESRPPTTSVTERTAIKFDAHLASKGKQLLRITDLDTWRGDNRSEPLRFPNFQLDSTPAQINRALLLDLGDWVPYERGTPVKFNVMDRDHRGVESLVIRRAEEIVEKIALSGTGIHERRFDHCGDYTAHVTHADGSESTKCEFAVCDLRLHLPSDRISMQEAWQVGFESENIDIIAVYLWNSNDSYGRHPLFLTAEQQAAGRLTIPAGLLKKPGTLQVWLIGEHKLGRLKLRRDLTLVE